MTWEIGSGLKALYHGAMVSAGASVIVLSFLNQMIFDVPFNSAWYFRFFEWFAILIAMSLVRDNWKELSELWRKQQ